MCCFIHFTCSRVLAIFCACNCGLFSLYMFGNQSTQIRTFFNILKCRLYCILSRIKNQLFGTIHVYAKWCKLSKYTNLDCFVMLKCRLHCFNEEKHIRGVLYQGYI
jgi:hypothetical protein